MFPVLQRSSPCLCHFKKEVCVASLKARLQPALSLQNMKSHQHRAKEQREAENLERKHERGELKESSFSIFLILSSTVLWSFKPSDRPMPNSVVVVNHLLLYFSLYCS